MNIELLPGIYELQSIESFKDGIKTSESAKHGLLTITPECKMSVVNSSHEWLMAYNGTIELKDDVLCIRLISCSSKELEGTTIFRKVLFLDGENLVLESAKDDRSKVSNISWKKINKIELANIHQKQLEKTVNSAGK